MSKKCVFCGLEKPETEFYSNNRKKCKLCKKAYVKKYNSLHKASIANKAKNYRESKKEQIATKKQQWCQKNKIKVAENYKEWYCLNRDKKLQYEKLYADQNRTSLKDKRATYRKQKLQKDELFALKVRIRRLISVSLKNKGFSKKTKTYQILGCSFEDLLKHLEYCFEQRYGRLPSKEDVIEIDHIKPLALAKTEEEVISLHDFNNLQWLLKEDNRRKSDFYEEVL